MKEMETVEICMRPVSTETWVLSLGLGPGKNFGETETYAYNILIIIIIVNKSMNYTSMSTMIDYHWLS